MIISFFLHTQLYLFFILVDGVEIAAVIVIHGCENEEEMTKAINSLKDYLNKGKYVIKLEKASYGCILLYISIQTTKINDTFVWVDLTELIEKLLGVSKVDCDVTATCRLFNVILDTGMKL